MLQAVPRGRTPSPMTPRSRVQSTPTANATVKSSPASSSPGLIDRAMSGDKVDDSDPGGLRAVAALSLSLEARLELLAAEAEYQAERIAGGRYFVACVGQFKRGRP